MPATVIAGHSHIVALGVPLKSDDGLVRLVSLGAEGARAEFEGLLGGWPRDDLYWNEMFRIAADRRIALLWEGNQYHGAFMFAPDPPVDFVLSEDALVPVGADAQLLPERALRAKLAPSLAGLDYLLRTLRQRGLSPPLLVGTPAPIGDNEALRAFLVRDFFFKQIAQNLGIDLDTAPLSSPVLRYKLWRLVQRMTRELGEKYGATFHPTPARSQQPDGCLRQEYWEDTSHANAAYGRLVLEELALALPSREP